MTHSAPKIGIISCRPLPEPDPDEPLLVDSLRALGAMPQVIAWRTGAETAQSMDLCVLRSCWDYYTAPTEFLAWLTAVARHTRLLNPLPVARWNMHKGYLRELSAAGLPTVPTRFIGQGRAEAVPTEVAALDCDDIVVKPAISAGSFRTRRFTGDADAATTFATDLVATGDVMVQPYIRSVDTTGERSLVFIDGELTHSVRKSPRFAGDDEHVVPMEVTSAMRAIGEAAMEAAPSGLGYGRVDLVEDNDGRPCIAELELLEPSLFLCHSDHALQRFSRSLVERAQG